MTSDSTDPRAGRDRASEPRDDIQEGRALASSAARSRSGAIWVAVVSALILLLLLIVFFIQNEAPVLVAFFGFEGSIALGLALLIAAVGGGIVVALVGAIRIIKLRASNRRSHK
ncbi:lipopolysaccharide assembly protein LapA domain-containing protein [Arthrobacter roseus]|uniref:lipopolysaccharide assembly protein LapA domain-containing protein n=1 Tax=Arthrobacter roseus TaxID=136274 RepID=UPI0019664772|nr:lipopolysaccharide assembly protein LapA domain-containing protein [Arthrobacter roseus]MBM7847194.1 putative integral membrane protein [Arthrobacter roseus]